MHNVNPFDNERFSPVALTTAINKRDNEYNLLGQIGLFNGGGGLDTDVVKVETRNQRISIVETSPRGTPAPKSDTPDGRNVRLLPTFRHARTHNVLASEVQGVRMFGSDNQMETVDHAVAKKLDKIHREHRQTMEFLRWGALKGDVYDADGVTVLYNSYSAMGEEQYEIEWDLTNANAVDPIQDGNDELLDYLETNALGESISGVVKFCSPGYMQAMQKNKDFREAFKYFEGQPNPNRNGLRTPFYFKGATYIRHMGSCAFQAADGSTIKHTFIPDNEAIAVPTGTYDTFNSYYAPGEFLETVNTMGIPLYIKTDMMKHNIGMELTYYSYPLHLVTKPRLVVRCKIKP